MKIDILGVKINTEGKSEVLQQVDTLLNKNKSIFIVTPYSETLVAAQKNEEFRNILNAADFALADGAGVVWAARQLGQKIAERIPGREFIWDLSELAASRGESIFLLGGFGNTPQIVAARLTERFPKIRIAGVSSPPREEGVGEVIVAQINNSGASLLFVALGPVYQEKWIYRNLPKLRVKLAMGVGGTFDYIAGIRPLPPQFLASSGLEWLWRLVTQPWRALRITRGVLGLTWLTLRTKLSRRTK